MGTSGQNRRSAKALYPKRGEIYLASFDPSLGLEIKKTRPALVIQNDIGNRVTEMTIVAPITSTVRFPLNPVHVIIPAAAATGLTVVSVALMNQIRAIDRVRLVKRLGMIDAQTQEQVDEAIKISLGLIPL